MAFTFTVETGAGVAGANAYCTVAFADDYHDAHLYAATWTAAGDLQRQRALAMASRLLDEHVEWHGTKYDEDNPLSWPRYGARDRDGYVIDNDEIPTDLKRATAELARHLLGEDLTVEDDTKGFKELAAGSLRMVIDKADRIPVIPDAVYRIIRPLGTVAGYSRTRKLLRT